jgi:glycosyltransferase involved in cell wall biosynthesis
MTSASGRPLMRKHAPSNSRSHLLDPETPQTPERDTEPDASSQLLTSQELKLRAAEMSTRPTPGISQEDLMSSPRVSIVIPALNEERNIPHVFARIPEDTHEIILVDGRSVDNTVEVARKIRPDVCVISQTRKGKGNALACGFEVATGDVIAMVDADGSADPAEIPRFLAALVDGADFAKGTRFSAGGGSSDITRLRRLGNGALTSFFNVCYGRKYSDLCYGYNVFWRKYVPTLGLDAYSPSREDGSPLWGDGFEVETLIHVRVAQACLRVAEVPSYEYSRIHGVSNLNAVRDGLRVVRTMLAEKGGSRHSATASSVIPIGASNYPTEKSVR